MASRRADKGAQEFAALVQQAAQVVLSSLSSSSMKAYNASIHMFINFIESLPVKLKTFPATVGHIVLFISHLHGKGYAHSSILTKISALSYWHKAFGKQDPANHFLIKRASFHKSFRCPLTQLLYFAKCSKIGLAYLYSYSCLGLCSLHHFTHFCDQARWPNLAIP